MIPGKALIPVTLLTGFLGSGKTTVLNALVRRPEMARTLVIINEFGQIGLDHLMVAHSAEDIVVEMSSGCLCCTIRGDLVKVLGEAVWRYSRDGQRQFDRVVIETTGLADPAPILHTLMTDPVVAGRYRLDGVVTTIDLATGMATLDVHPEAVKQAAVADVLLLTKEDIAEPAQIRQLQERLALINPGAEQHKVHEGAVSPSRLLNIGLFDLEGKSPDVERWLKAEAYADVPHKHRQGYDHEEHHGHHEVHEHGQVERHHRHDVNRHDDHIRAFSVSVEKPIDPLVLEAWLEVLLTLLGPQMLRMKAVLNMRDEELPAVLHAVQHIMHPPTVLPAWPTEDRCSRWVFITRDVDRSVIEQSLRHFMDAGAAVAANQEPAPW